MLLREDAKIIAREMTVDTERDYQIYVLHRTGEWTMQDIANRVGISRQRVHQILKEKRKEPMSDA